MNKSMNRQLIRILIGIIIGIIISVIISTIFISIGYTKLHGENLTNLSVEVLGMPIFEITNAGAEGHAVYGNMMMFGVMWSVVCTVIIEIIHYVKVGRSIPVIHK